MSDVLYQINDADRLEYQSKINKYKNGIQRQNSYLDEAEKTKELYKKQKDRVINQRKKFNNRIEDLENENRNIGSIFNVELDNKDKIIYSLQIKNSELEVIVSKQNILITELEKQLEGVINKIKDQNKLKEFEIKKKFDNYKIEINKFNNVKENYNFEIEKLKKENNFLFNNNSEFRIKNQELNDYIRELKLIIDNNNYVVKDLQEEVKNINNNYSNNILKEECIKNYYCLKDVKHHYNSLLDIIENIK